MCHAAVNWVISAARFPSDIRPQARWLLVHIADRADRDRWECWPSHKLLAEDAGMTSRSVLNLLAELENAGFITRREQRRGDGSRGTDIITLKRPENFSVPGKEQPEAPKNTTGQGEKSSVQKEGREPGKGTLLTETSSSAHGSRLPDGWIPDFDCATQIGLTLETAKREAEKFRDYWISQPGQRGRKLDWDATWRNWCRKRVEENPHGRGTSASPSGLSRRAENAIEGLMEAPDPRRGRWSL